MLDMDVFCSIINWCAARLPSRFGIQQRQPIAPHHLSRWSCLNARPFLTSLMTGPSTKTVFTSAQCDKRRDSPFVAWYSFSMNPESSVIDRLMDPVGQCLTPEVAERIASLRADDKLQARVDELAHKANAGTLTDDERSQYEQYVSFSQFVTLLQIKARNLMDRTTGAA
jgi:hypothetical protein